MVPLRPRPAKQCTSVLHARLARRRDDGDEPLDLLRVRRAEVVHRQVVVLDVELGQDVGVERGLGEADDDADPGVLEQTRRALRRSYGRPIAARTSGTIQVRFPCVSNIALLRLRTSQGLLPR